MDALRRARARNVVMTALLAVSCGVPLSSKSADAVPNADSPSSFGPGIRPSIPRQPVSPFEHVPGWGTRAPFANRAVGPLPPAGVAANAAFVAVGPTGPRPGPAGLQAAPALQAISPIRPGGLLPQSGLTYQQLPPFEPPMP